MKFLKNHGKKVSVVLLAMALMVTPMLNIVKAADDNSCEKKIVYLFAYSDTMVVEEIPYTVWKNKSSDYGENSEIQFTSLYQTAYGWEANATSAAGFDLTKYKNVILSDYQSGNIETTTEKRDPSKSYSAASNYSVDFTTSFGNKTSNNGTLVPDDAEILDEYSSGKWDSTIVNADYQLELLNYKKVMANKTLDENEIFTYDEGNTTYVMHGSWSDLNNVAMGGANSKTFPAINQIMAGATGTDGTTLTESSYKEKLLKAMINENKTGVIGKFTDNNEKFMTVINRDLTPEQIKSVGGKDNWFKIEYNTLPIDKKTADWITDDGKRYSTGNDLTEEEKNKAVHKTEYWIFVPATYTISIKDNSCETSVDTKDEAKENNPDTGVASYAIIGTLLVGAASAYIYARKNNKFNRV